MTVDEERRRFGACAPLVLFAPLMAVFWMAVLIGLWWWLQ